ncbi:hypothetical protein JCGZ_12709 [Jatropha curcas]|uniref:Uncharacterized protein n=1 Tax=Jatropha curcas TaxID=180498 RepID=A0A067KHE2_JATCU|nr:hypothetical protein JCGZ_12709 [Jatropha curcas]
MDGRFVCLSEHFSPCLSIELFEHKGKTYPSLKIFADVIDILVVEPKEYKLEKENKKEEKGEPDEEGVEGPQAAEEEGKKEE